MLPIICLALMHFVLYPVADLSLFSSEQADAEHKTLAEKRPQLVALKHYLVRPPEGRRGVDVQ